MIKETMHMEEFFIRKAIGWSLRNLARVRPDSVVKFVEENEEVLSPLSKKEALKAINKKNGGKTKRKKSEESQESQE